MAPTISALLICGPHFATAFLLVARWPQQHTTLTKGDILSSRFFLRRCSFAEVFSKPPFLSRWTHMLLPESLSVARCYVLIDLGLGERGFLPSLFPTSLTRSRTMPGREIGFPWNTLAFWEEEWVPAGGWWGLVQCWRIYGWQFHVGGVQKRLEEGLGGTLSNRSSKARSQGAAETDSRRRDSASRLRARQERRGLPRGAWWEHILGAHFS